MDSYLTWSFAFSEALVVIIRTDYISAASSWRAHLYSNIKNRALTGHSPVSSFEQLMRQFMKR